MITEEQKVRYKELLQEQKEINKKAMKNVRKSLIIQIIFGSIIGVLIVIMALVIVMSGNKNKELFTNYVLAAFVSFLIGCVIHVFIHELGHLIFGLLTDYEFLSFRIFSLIFYKKNGKIIRSKYKLEGTSGQCLMYPPRKDRNGTYPYVLYNLGGSINNLFFSIPWLLIVIATDNQLLWITSFAFMLSGILIGLMNLIPMNMGIQNDGMNVKSMRNDKAMEDAFYLQLKVNAEMSDGKRITEYEEQEFELPSYVEETNSLIFSVRLLSYYRKLALEEYEAAHMVLKDMEKFLEEYPMGLINTVRLERLFFSIMNHSPIEEIAAQVKGVTILLLKLKSNLSVLRIRYCLESLLNEEEKKDIITLVRGKKPGKAGKKKLETLYDLYIKFLNEVKKYPNEGEAAMQLSIVDKITNQRGTME